MNFDLNQFFRTNKKIFIWTAFFVLLYLIRRLFGLVFLTFILGFIFNNLIEWLTSKTRLPRRIYTVVVYLIFIALVINLFSMVVPRLGSESKAFIKELPITLDKVQTHLDELGHSQPRLLPLVIRMKDSLSMESLVGVDGERVMSLLVASFNQVTHYFSYFLLSTLFSFFILFDFPNLRERAMGLRETRLREVYEETAGSVVRFALVVGEAFQAQILIAIINTALTACGLWGLGIRPIALLSTIVFFAGLIPVLGVFISSIPILLLAFNAGGVHLTLGALIMIIVVHIVEAYILNPRIFSAVFKINPVLTLIILYIGHNLFGLWGVILSVPVCVYIYRYAIMGRNMVENASLKKSEDTESSKGDPPGPECEADPRPELPEKENIRPKLTGTIKS